MDTVYKVMIGIKIVALIILASVVGYYIIPFIFKAIVVCLLSITALSCMSVKSKRATKVVAIDQTGKTKRFAKGGK